MPAAAPQISMMRRSRESRTQATQLFQSQEPMALHRKCWVLRSCAATKSDGRDSCQQFREERAHVDVTLVLMVGADDLFGRVLVRIGGKNCMRMPVRMKPTNSPGTMAQ